MIRGLSAKGRNSLVGVGAIAVLVLSSPADAEDTRAIEAQLKALQAQISALQKEVEKAKAAAASAKASAEKSNSGDLDLDVKWRGAPELTSADGKFKMKVRGRLQADYNAIDQDERITGAPDVSAADIRRARLGIEGVVWADVKYIVEVDFANDTASLRDAYVEYTGLAEDLGLRFGNFKTFNGLEHLESANYLTFLERAAFQEAWTLDRQIGAGAIYAKDHYTLSAGIFGPRVAEEENWLQDVKTGSARLTLAPINQEGKVFHAGASWRTREGAEDLRGDPIPPNDQFFRYQARGADLHLADRFVSTPAIFDKDTFWGLEGLLIWKSFSVQGEYTQLKADSSPIFGINPDPTYDGWYVEANWFLTGESQTYQKGVIGRPKVKNPVFKGGYGAWQLAGRYDVLDLTDKAVNIAACNLCGEQKTWLISLNWWLNNHTRFQFQYSESDIDGGLMNGANLDNGATIKGFGARAQVDW